MRLSIYDSQLKLVDVVGESFISCLWSEGYNTVEKFTLEVADIATHRAAIVPDCFVGRNDRNTLMVVKTVVCEGGKITATGKPATALLEDLAFVGKIEANSTIANSLKTAYNESIGNALLTVDESTLTETYPSQISNKSVLELYETMCGEADIGFRAVKVIQDSIVSGIAIQLYKPIQNLNLKFSERIGNIQNASLTRSTQTYKNYAIVLGQGEDTNRVRVDVDLSNDGEKRQLIVDAREIQQGANEDLAAYTGRLYAKGLEKLLDRTRVWECAFEPMASEFGTRFDLGDIVTASLPEFGVIIQARIARFTQKFQAQATKTTLEVGEIMSIRSIYGN